MKLERQHRSGYSNTCNTDESASQPLFGSSYYTWAWPLGGNGTKSGDSGSHPFLFRLFLFCLALFYRQTADSCVVTCVCVFRLFCHSLSTQQGDKLKDFMMLRSSRSTLSMHQSCCFCLQNSFFFSVSRPHWTTESILYVGASVWNSLHTKDIWMPFIMSTLLTWWEPINQLSSTTDLLTPGWVVCRQPRWFLSRFFHSSVLLFAFLNAFFSLPSVHRWTDCD